MERPALERLLADIDARRVDTVVVYKVDRLTRSLGDFARIVEVFDRHSVSFVSITQQFNTTTSMGRLTLNMLLSFAQFEREVTGERIRDKIAASKAKGMWMGGQVPLGYDLPLADSRALVVNETEAEIVRTIFETYLELGSVHALRRWLDERNIRSKHRTTQKGETVGGQPFSRGALFHLLRNQIYLGMIVHKAKVHPGMHPAIVDPDLFEAV
jgi:DNA invertase Pin-like site-specific DNA recombinase